MAAGGLERVVEMLAIGQRSAGTDARVLALLDRRGPHPFVEALERHGVPVTPLVIPPRGYLAEHRGVRSLARALDGPVIHTHGYRPDVIASAAARAEGCVTVSTVHGFTGGGWKNRLYEFLQQRALRRADAVVAVAGPVASRLRGAGVSGERLFTVPNAFQPYAGLLSRDAARAELGIPSDAVRFGWVGRMSHEKGPDVCVDAAARLVGTGVGISMIGEGPVRAALSERAGESILTWHGMIHEAGRYLRAFDAFILSSRTEGTPIALLEAMSAGVPVVATRVGGVPDVVSPDEALLVPPDDPAALASALDTLLRDPAATRARASAARRRVEHAHATPPWVAAYDRVYAAARARRPTLNPIAPVLDRATPLR